MSRDGAIDLDWADGTYRFRIGLGQVRELQEKCDAGPATIFGRLADGSWRIDDFRETIRLGLIGGGLEPAKALVLVKRYVDDRAWLESVLPAEVILGAALSGVEDEPLGKDRAATEDETIPSPEGNSASPPSMAPAPSSAIPPPTSTP